MAAIDEIYRYLNEIAPFSTAMDFDNAGFLVGDGKTEVTKVLVTLDITAQSVRQAREKGAQLIVSHHPVIFHPLKRLLSNSVPYLLAKELFDRCGDEDTRPHPEREGSCYGLPNAE